MSDELDPTYKLHALAEQLGADDWRIVMQAETALASAGQAGIDATLWGPKGTFPMCYITQLGLT